MTPPPALCTRCGDPAEVYRVVADTTFWGAVETSTRTRQERTVRVLGVFVRRTEPTSHIRTDEQQALCDECWSLLVGDFLAGKAVPAVEGP